MRIGLFAGTTPETSHNLAGLVDFAKDTESRGFNTLWLPNIFGMDGVGTAALLGWETEKIELGTAVTPTYPRHPAALAQQALTTQVACSNRFALGIGLSHQLVIEGMFGMSYDKPARHMAEYLSIIAPLLRGEGVEFEGEQLTGKLSLSISLNGRAEIHERVRGAGSHARAHRGIRTALDHDLAVEVFTTVGQELLPGLTGFAEELFTEYPALFRLVLIQNHRVSNDYYQFKEDLLGPEDFIRLVENAALLSLAGYPIHFLDNALANVVAARKSMPFLPRSPDIRRFDHLTVLANKEMTPYHSCRESFGTYETGRMKAVVGSSEHENRVAPEERLCGDCPYYSGCRSNGMNRPSDTTLDYEEELYCRRVNRLLDASEA